MSLTLRMGDDIITGQAANIQTKNTATGGYASVTFDVKRKLDQALFDTFTNVFTYDSATGEQTGGGRLLEQGRNNDGTWQVTCLGEGLASMQDVTTPTFYVDSSIDADTWIRRSRTTKRFNVTVGQYPVQTDDDPTLVMDMTEGVVIAATSSIAMVNKIPLLCGQLLGGLGFRHKAGISNSNFRARGQAYSADLTASDTVIDDAWSTTISGRLTMTVDGDFTNRPVAGLEWKRITTDSPTTTEDYWATIRDLTITAQIYDADGSLITTGYDREYFNTHEVLTDWVVRYCPRLNAATGVIATATEHIEQMAYLDGVSGMQLADDLNAIEPGFTWQVWEQGSDGRWPFYYQAPPTGIQYEASTADGFTAPSPTSEVYNSVVVTGKTPAGRDISLTVSQTVAALTAAGVTRRATVALGSEIWSTTAATKVGDQFLDDHAVAPGAGTITIARPIYDAIKNRWIGPQHIRSGGLMRVRGIQPTVDTISTTTADGATVFRVVSATYDNDSNSTVCELDAYTLTEASVVAAAAKAAGGVAKGHGRRGAS